MKSYFTALSFSAPRKDDNDVCIHLVALYFDNVLQSLSNGNNQTHHKTLLLTTHLNISIEEFGSLQSLHTADTGNGK